MTIVKTSFKNRPVKNKEVKKLGLEHAGLIENNPANYAKTGDWKSLSPKISSVCIGCQKCVKNCPEAAIEIKSVNGKKKAVVDYNYCKGCAICVRICPVKAIKMEK